LTIKGLKVLILSHMYPSAYDPVYGIFVHKQVLELIKQGCEVTVVRPLPMAPFPLNLISDKWRQYRRFKDSEIIDGVKVYYPRYISFPRLLFYQYSGWLMYRGLRRLIKELRGKYSYDLINAHVALPDGYAGMLIKERLNKVPLLVTVHGIDLYHTIDHNPGCRRAVERVFRSADQVIMVSNKLKQLALKNFGQLENIKVIGNGVDLFAVESLARKPVNSSGVKKANEPIMITVAELIERKKIDLTLMALSKVSKRFPELRYIIVGDGPEKGKLKDLSGRLGLMERVEFRGKIVHGEVIDLMKEADLFVLPSLREAFGVVYIEAMACGKPVIACRGEGIEDVIEDGVNGILVEPNDVDDLVKKIELLLSDRKRAEQIGQAGRKLVLENYTWAENARKTIALYKEVLGDG